MYQLLLIIHFLIAISIIGLVLLQHGKGADAGAAFGSGASSTVFGSQGTGGFLFKLTGGLVLAFFSTSVLLSATVAKQHSAAFNLTVVDDKNKSTEASLPVIPVPEA